MTINYFEKRSVKRRAVISNICFDKAGIKTDISRNYFLSFNG